MAGIGAQLSGLAPFLLVLLLALASASAGVVKAEKKQSHFRVYMHDITGGGNASSVIIPAISATSSSWFGLVRMIDNSLTVGAGQSSNLLVKVQGMYATSSQENISLLMTMSFTFVSGKYNGSSVVIVGRNPIGEKVRELPVIGGTGAFRFVRGFVRATTFKIDLVSS